MVRRTLSARQLKAEHQTFVEALYASRGVFYLDQLPVVIPPGKALVHNSVRPTRHLGVRGFRAWLVDAADYSGGRRVMCDCGFASELGTHYRMQPPSPTP